MEVVFLKLTLNFPAWQSSINETKQPLYLSGDYLFEQNPSQVWLLLKTLSSPYWGGGHLPMAISAMTGVQWAIPSIKIQIVGLVTICLLYHSNRDTVRKSPICRRPRGTKLHHQGLAESNKHMLRRACHRGLHNTTNNSHQSQLVWG